MSFEKYYKLVEEQAKAHDKQQNCNIGQTWKYHLFPVIKNACFLAEKYGANKDIVEVASIFHDYADLIDYANNDNHHVLGAELAGEILLKDGHDKSFVEHVQKCIYNHRASVVKDKFSMEEICVADADAMSHLDNFVELLLWRGYICESVEKANNFVKRKIEKSYAKMSEQTKLLMKDKYDAIMKVLL
ncbi:MAG: HD domain-containing protein [Clostridia bacterium]